MSLPEANFKGTVTPFFPHFFLDGADVCSRIELPGVPTKQGGPIDIMQGQKLTILGRYRRSDDEVAVEWGGKIAYVPVMLNGYRTLGISKPDTEKYLGGRRLRKVLLACQTNNLEQLIRTSEKVDPWYKPWHRKFCFNRVDEFGMTPFLMASAYSSFDIIEHLIVDGKAEVRHIDYFGRSALHYLCLVACSLGEDEATFTRRLHVIEYLVVLGMGVKSRCALGKTPAQYVLESYEKNLLNADRKSALVNALNGKVSNSEGNNLLVTIARWNAAEVNSGDDIVDTVNLGHGYTRNGCHTPSTSAYSDLNDPVIRPPRNAGNPRERNQVDNQNRNNPLEDDCMKV